MFAGMGSSLTSVVIPLGLLALISTPARADVWGLPDFAVFGTNSVTINDSLDENTTCITGNVGTGGTAAGALSLNKCRVQGNVDVTTSPVLLLGSHGAYSGSLITGSLTGVGATMSAVSSALAGLPANLTFASLTDVNETFTNSSTTGGTYVIDVSGDVTTTNPYIWTFAAANANDKFVVNIGGNAALAQLQIGLTGGITAGQVIFNLTGSSCSAEVNKSNSVWFGDILAPGCDVRVHNPFPFTGNIFGETVTVDSGAGLGGSASVPEPSFLPVLLVFGLAISIFKTSRARRSFDRLLER